MELNSSSAHLSFSGQSERSVGGCVLASTYFGPLQWYQKLYRYSTCFIDGCEHFVKQTYRNRCVIASTNGPLSGGTHRWKFGHALGHEGYSH